MRYALLGLGLMCMLGCGERVALRATLEAPSGLEPTFYFSGKSGGGLVCHELGVFEEQTKTDTWQLASERPKGGGSGVGTIHTLHYGVTPQGFTEITPPGLLKTGTKYVLMARLGDHRRLWMFNITRSSPGRNEIAIEEIE